ncbi:MAG: hypothetical protein ABI890_04650 [Lapillicoccus sp.]
MRTPRVIALVIGALLVLPGLGLATAGAGLGLASVMNRDTSGFVRTDTARLESSTPALTSGALAVIVDANTPQWVVDHLATDVRLTASGADGAVPVFVGVARTTDVDAYLAGVAYDEVATTNGNPTYHRVPAAGGTTAMAPPGDQTFWAASTAGTGPLQLDWKVTPGSWTVVLMNADSRPGIAATLTPSVRSDALVPLTVTLLVTGLLLITAAVVLFVVAFRPRRGHVPTDGVRETSPVPAVIR